MDQNRLTDDDLAYHRRVVQQRADALAVERAWAQHVAEKYRLGPGEHVDQDGLLHRATAPVAAPPDA